MKKIFTFFLLAALLTGTISCEDANVPADADTTTDNSTPIETTEPDPGDSIPELDFDGTVINIVTHDPANTKTNTPNLDVETLNGEVLNDAVYEQNRALESRFHFIINETYQKSVNDTTTAVKASVTAADNAYDIATIVDRDAFAMYAEGYVISYEDMPYIDLNQSYWDEGTKVNMTIGGKTPFAYGAMNLTAYDYTALLAYNKNIAEDYGIGNLYDTAFAGDWTYDVMESMMKTVHSDVDGDGAYDDGDLFAISGRSEKAIVPMWISAGALSVTKDENDIPAFTVATDEKFLTVFLQIFNLYIDQGYWLDTTSTVTDIQADVFLADGSLFFTTNFKSIGSYLRDMTSDFGVLPYPKYDDDQKDYISRVECGFPSVVLSTCNKTEAAGAFLEASAYAAAENIVPAYYEITLKNKVARDVESAKMLDMIFRTRTVDLGDTYWYSEIRWKLTNLIAEKDNAIASQAQSIASAANKTIQTMVSKVLEQQGGKTS